MFSNKLNGLILTIILGLTILGTLLVSLVNSKAVSADGQSVTFVYVSGPSKAYTGEDIEFVVDVNNDVAFPVRYYWQVVGGSYILDSSSQVISSSQAIFELGIPTVVTSAFNVEVWAEAIYAPGVLTASQQLTIMQGIPGAYVTINNQDLATNEPQEINTEKLLTGDVVYPITTSLSLIGAVPSEVTLWANDHCANSQTYTAKCNYDPEMLRPEDGMLLEYGFNIWVNGQNALIF